MEHAKEVIKSSLSLFTANVIISISSILFIVIATRFLNKEEMALVALLFIVSAFVSLLGNLGIGASAEKNVPELKAKGEQEKVKELITNATYLPILGAFLTGCILFIFSHQISAIFLKSHTYGNIIKLVIFTAIFCSIYDSLIFPLYALQMFTQVSLALTIGNLSQRILAIFLYFIFGFKGIIFGFCFGALIANLFIFYQLRIFLCKLTGSWMQIIKYSFPFYIAGFTRYATMQLDKLLVGIFLSPQALALYFVVEKIPRFSTALIESVTTPTIRKLTEFKAFGEQKVIEAFKKTSRYLSLGFIPLFLGLISISYPLLHLYAGKQYLNGFPILVILLLSSLLYVYYSLYSGTTYIMGAPQVRLKYEIVTAFSGLIFMLLLIPIFQAVGAALAHLFGFLCGLFYIRYLLKKLLPGLPSDLSAFKCSLFNSLPPLILIILLQIWHYELWLVPFYFLIGASIFFFNLKKKLKEEDKKLLGIIFSDKYLFLKKWLKIV